MAEMCVHEPFLFYHIGDSSSGVFFSIWQMLTIHFERLEIVWFFFFLIHISLLIGFQFT